jgi:hypothetical protein
MFGNVPRDGSRASREWPMFLRFSIPARYREKFAEIGTIRYRSFTRHSTSRLPTCHRNCTFAESDCGRHAATWTSTPRNVVCHCSIRHLARLAFFYSRIRQIGGGDNHHMAKGNARIKARGPGHNYLQVRSTPAVEMAFDRDSPAT